ncbi:SDR family NAD(P)-dependent oxidoreductase [Promicromonospora vindobonensis]|uniref:SDR family NAD(P)-dependent oxidoreductase n=1 Tax=Promicromonospora vindobonensis TaxID=195748 RepID=A0ABW5VX59_9MICO
MNSARTAGPAAPARTAIVTGGAGGIGSAICRGLAEAGYGVVVADVDVDRARATADALPRVGGVTHRAFAGDLTRSEVNAELAGLAAGTAPIGAVVNAVGISPKRDGRKIPFAELDDETWNRVLAVNVSAPFFLVREAAPLMPTDGTGSIVNLLSITASVGTGGPEDAPFYPRLPSTIAYGASKAALRNLTASLAHELAGKHIRVNGVAPGFVETPMMAAVPRDSGITDQVPLRRFARPEEIADAVAFLVSERASYITGASLDVTGGFTTC